MGKAIILCKAWQELHTVHTWEAKTLPGQVRYYVTCLQIQFNDCFDSADAESTLINMQIRWL